VGNFRLLTTEEPWTEEPSALPKLFHHDHLAYRSTKSIGDYDMLETLAPELSDGGERGGRSGS
jgi:hypothetical protein